MYRSAYITASGGTCVTFGRLLLLDMLQVSVDMAQEFLHQLDTTVAQLFKPVPGAEHDVRLIKMALEIVNKGINLFPLGELVKCTEYVCDTIAMTSRYEARGRNKNPDDPRRLRLETAILNSRASCAALARLSRKVTGYMVDQLEASSRA